MNKTVVILDPKPLDFKLNTQHLCCFYLPLLALCTDLFIRIRQGKEDICEHDHQPLRAEDDGAPEDGVTMFCTPVVHNDPKVMVELQQRVELCLLYTLCHGHGLQLNGGRSHQMWCQNIISKMYHHRQTFCTMPVFVSFCYLTGYQVRYTISKIPKH